MKKTIFLAIIASSLFACSTPSDKKTETTTTDATATSATTAGTVTTTGPEVELMKKALNAWATADWATYLSCYADTAVSVHNAWAQSNDTTIARKVPSYIDLFKKSRLQMDGNVSVDNSIFEVVTMPNGSKYGHAWVGVSWKNKKGETSKTTIFNSYGIQDGKFTYDWPIYDNKEFDKLLK